MEEKEYLATEFISACCLCGDWRCEAEAVTDKEVEPGICFPSNLPGILRAAVVLVQQRTELLAADQLNNEECELRTILSGEHVGDCVAISCYSLGKQRLVLS